MPDDPCCNVRAEIEVLKTKVKGIDKEHGVFRESLHGVREKASVAYAIAETIQGQDLGTRMSLVEAWRKQFEVMFEKFVKQQGESNREVANEVKGIIKGQNKILMWGTAIFMAIQIVQTILKFK